MATTQAPSDPLGGISSTFLKWMTDDLLPYLYASVVMLFMITGLILHSLIIHALRKHDRFKDPFHKIILHVSVMDLMYILVLMTLGVVHCFADHWLLGDAGCKALAIIFNVLFSMTFSYSVWSGLERLICVTNSGLWQKMFLSGCFFPLMVGVNWLLIIGLCCLALPEIGISSTTYYEVGFQCDFDHSASILYVNIYLAVVYFVPFILFITFTSISIHIRRRQINSLADATAFITGGVVSRQNSTRQDARGNQTRNDDYTSDAENVNNSNNESVMAGPSRDYEEANTVPPLHPASDTGRRSTRNSSVVARTSYMQVYQEHLDFHRGLTMTIVWLMIFLVWIPYVVSAYRLAVEGGVGPVWAGWYPITIMFANLTFVLKPIIFLAHNKHIKEDVQSIFSSKALDTARTMVTKLDDKIQTMDQILFKTPKSNTRAVRAVANAKVSLSRWKDRLSSKKTTKTEVALDRVPVISNNDGIQTGEATITTCEDPISRAEVEMATVGNQQATTNSMKTDNTNEESIEMEGTTK